MSLSQVAEPNVTNGSCKVCWMLDILPDEDSAWLKRQLENVDVSADWIALQCKRDADTPDVGSTTIKRHRRECMS